MSSIRYMHSAKCRPIWASVSAALVAGFLLTGASILGVPITHAQARGVPGPYVPPETDSSEFAKLAREGIRQFVAVEGFG